MNSAARADEEEPSRIRAARNALRIDLCRIDQCRIGGDRELDDHRRAGAWHAVDREPAAVKLDDGLGEGQAQAHALIAGIVGGALAVERSNDEVEILGPYADPGIADDDLEGRARFLARDRHG